MVKYEIVLFLKYIFFKDINKLTYIVKLLIILMFSLWRESKLKL